MANALIQNTWETKAQLAARKSVCSRTVTNWMEQGKIPFRKLSERMVRFDPVEVDEALNKFRIDGKGRAA